MQNHRGGDGGRNFAFSRRIGETVHEQEQIAKAAEKARTFLSSKEIKIEGFPNYDLRDIALDLEYVADRERGFESSRTPEGQINKDLATVFEAVVDSGISQCGWFGPKATAITTSRYDDYKNGVDTIIEIEPQASMFSLLGLAVDVTYTQDLSKKMNIIVSGIQKEKGELGYIKYFKSEKSGYAGEKRNVPRIVVGADAPVVQAVANLWAGEDMEALKKHPIQAQILEEAIMQCKAFSDLADKEGKIMIAAAYENMAGVLASIFEPKKGLARMSDFRENDRVFAGIREYLDGLKRGM